MKTVFLTGATGNMGREAMKELLSRSDRFQIKILVLPHEKNKPLVQEWEQNPNVTIVYGNLTNYDDVLQCVTGADYVLHVG